jgi:hypothetical protein
MTMPKIKPREPKETTGTGSPTVFEANVRVDGEPSKNYIKCAPFADPVPQPVPFLMGRDGKLYVEKSRVPAGSKGFRITIESVS